MIDDDPIVVAFHRHLAEIAHHWRGRPDRELDALLLVGVEREAVVTVAYRKDAVDGRLATMPLDPDVRALVSRAIRWVWRDEETHTLWVRGALLRRAEPTLRARAVAAQIGGWLGGFTSSRQAHLTWREAPLRRLVAELLESAGGAIGKIPPEVRSHLHYGTFSAFCRFNHSAEHTAMLGWRRMAALARDPASGVSPADVEGFARLAEDERRHAELFALFADTFDDQDRARVDAPTLAAAIARIGQRFVAVPPQGGAAWKNPLGKGGPVVVREGADPETLVASVLDRLGFDPSGRTVALKTTFMRVTRKDDPSPGVSPALLTALVDALVRRGATVRVLDAGNLYDRFHDGRSVGAVARWLGLPFPVDDTQDDQVPHGYLRGIGEDTVSRVWRDADLRVVLGKLVSHPTAKVFLALEAAEGLGVRHDDLVFLDRRAERETATLMVLDAFPPDLALLDAWEAVPDGLMGFAGAVSPLRPHRLYGSRDAVALDAVAARHVGLDPSDEALLVRHAFDWFGDPRPAPVDGPDTPIATFRLPDHTRRTALLAQLAWPVWAHAGLRGALFLPSFDEVAFPSKGASVAVRAMRAAVHRIVDDPVPHVAVHGLLPTTWTDVGGGAVRTARIGAGPHATILLHGYPDTLQVWSALAPLLDGPVIAFDWPGLGFSTAWPGPCDPRALAETLRSLLDLWGVQTATLVAHDMGGPPALAFAAAWPERVRRVVVMNSLLFGDAETSWEIAVMRRRGLASAAFGWAPGLVYDRSIHSFLPAGEVLPDALDADLRGAFSRVETRRRLAAMCAAYDEALPSLPATFFGVRCPVDLVWAEHDAHFPVVHAERLRAILPSARLRVVPGAHHWMVWSRAADVAALVRS